MKKKTVLILAVLLTAIGSQAQNKTEAGLTGGAIGFFPSYYEHMASGTLSMDFGAGWSAGAYMEQHWKPRFHQIIELNYYSLNSKVEFTKHILRQIGYGYDAVTFYSQNESFPQIALSGGIKFFISDHFFVYPGFEFSRALSSNVIANKTSYNLKLGAGVKFGNVDVLLEFSQGLKKQGIVYDEPTWLTAWHAYRYLQLKVQVPIYKFKL